MEHGGQRVGRGEDLQRGEDLPSGVAHDLQVLRPEQAGPAVEVLGVGQLVDEGEVVEGDGVGLDVELAPLEFGTRAQVDDRPDVEPAQHGQVGLGQLAQPISAEERAPTRRLPAPAS